MLLAHFEVHIESPLLHNKWNPPSVHNQLLPEELHLLFSLHLYTQVQSHNPCNIHSSVHQTQTLSHMFPLQFHIPEAENDCLLSNNKYLPFLPAAYPIFHFVKYHSQ